MRYCPKKKEAASATLPPKKTRLGAFSLLLLQEHSRGMYIG